MVGSLAIRNPPGRGSVPFTFASSGWDDAFLRTEKCSGAINWHTARSLLPSETITSLSLHDTIETIADLILGTRENRFGPRPKDPDREIIRHRVRRWVESGEPVRMFVMWGGIKHYIPDEEQGIDLAELFVAQQFIRLHEAISSLYAPGLRVRFYLEDFGVLYEDAGGRSDEAQRRVADTIEAYLAPLETLVEILAPGWGEPVRVGGLLRRADDPDWAVRQADRNLALLHDYWRESEVAPEGTAERLASYRALEEMGWSGTIPPPMRRHYLERLTCLYPDASWEEKVDRLLRYFAVVLLYTQTGVIRNRESDSIKVSLFKPAPGIPSERVRGRIHLRALPRSICHEAMPAWTCKGCLALSPEGRVTPATVSFRVCHRDFRRFSEGRITLRDGGRSVALRSDILLPDSMPGGRYVRLARSPGLEPILAGDPSPA